MSGTNNKIEPCLVPLQYLYSTLFAQNIWC